jgi:methylase of polypeptide subunit release factors
LISILRNPRFVVKYEKKKIKLQQSSDIYPPQEDTWFLTDVLKEFLANKKEVFGEIITACEIGIGSGYISTILGGFFPNIHFIGVDITFPALKLSYENMLQWVQFERFSLLCSSHLTALNPRKFKPDVIYFNPPYVRTSTQEYERNDDPLIRAWAGGPSGTDVIQQFLNDLKRFNFGTAFFLTSNINDNNHYQNIFQKDFRIDVLAKKKIVEEILLCFQVTRKEELFS